MGPVLRTIFLVLTLSSAGLTLGCGPKKPVALSINPLGDKAALIPKPRPDLYRNLSVFVANPSDERDEKFIAEIDGQLLRSKQNAAAMLMQLLEVAFENNSVDISPKGAATVQSHLLDWFATEQSGLTSTELSTLVRYRVRILDSNSNIRFERTYRSEIRIQQPFIPLQRIELTLQEAMINTINKQFSDKEFLTAFLEAQRPLS